MGSRLETEVPSTAEKNRRISKITSWSELALRSDQERQMARSFVRRMLSVGIPCCNRAPLMVGDLDPQIAEVRRD